MDQDLDNVNRLDDDSAESSAEKVDLEEIKKIIGAVGDSIDLLFHTPDGLFYADVIVDGHRETLEIKGSRFKRFFRHECWELGIPLKAEDLKLAISNLEAQAEFKGPKIVIYLRVAAVDNTIWIDLCDNDWRAIKVTAEGWQVVARPAVHFTRMPGMLPLPQPQRGGTVEDLQEFINFRTAEDFTLIVAFVLGALSGQKPFPVLALIGEQGSAKSEMVRFVRGLIDPSTVELLAPPNSNRDLFIAARNCFLLAYDNISKLTPELSDSLARLATEGGIRLRTLYTDVDETLINAARPIILNGIRDFVTREDLQDRAAILSPPHISGGARIMVADIRARYEAKRPYILGAFLDALTIGLGNKNQPVPKNLPRMADWAVWCLRAGLHNILDAIESNQMNAVQVMLEANPLAIAVRKMGSKHEFWKGTATELRQVLETFGYTDTEKNSLVLANKLRDIAPHLRRVGVDLDFKPRKANSRLITIAWTANAATPASRSSQSSQPE
jgi:hypothetical protein